MEHEEAAADADTSARMVVLDGVLGPLVQRLAEVLGDDLASVVLFGSAAEGRLRARSDVNLLVLLKRFDAARIDRLREALRLAHAAARIEPMFLLVDELPAAAELFAVKFDDMRRRYRLLHGEDCLRTLAIDAGELRRRAREVLLNLAIRLRQRYALVSLREEQLPAVLAEAAGPLRAAAAALLDLQGKAAASPRAALEGVAAATGQADYVQAVAIISQAREQGRLAAGIAGPALLALSRLADHLRRELELAVK